MRRTRPARKSAPPTESTPSGGSDRAPSPYAPQRDTRFKNDTGNGGASTRSVPEPRLQLGDIDRQLVLRVLAGLHGSARLDDVDTLLVRRRSGDRRQMTRAQLRAAVNSLAADGLVRLHMWDAAVGVELVEGARA